MPIMARRDENEEEWTEVDHDEEEESEWDDDEEESDDDDEDPLKPGSSILWLCQEGQMQQARKRFEALMNKINQDRDSEAAEHQLKREVFQSGRDSNYPLHEILMGGTSDQNACTLAKAILDFGISYPLECRTMLFVQPPSHRRTALHWAAWSNAGLSELRALVMGNPEALAMRDKKSHGSRTPVEILRHYYPEQRDKASCLEKLARSWKGHRLRIAVHLSCHRHFVRNDLTPFDKNDRKVAGIKPRPWFALSVMGFLLQREMKPLAMHILSFLGKNAKFESQSNKKKRKRKS